jgi:hypothetical protein
LNLCVLRQGDIVFSPLNEQRLFAHMGIMSHLGGWTFYDSGHIGLKKRDLL